MNIVRGEGPGMDPSLRSEEDVLNDFSASYWLKNALSSALQCDPIDASRDAELLARLLRERADALLTWATRENMIGRIATQPSGRQPR
jgi:hypothetical protein